MSEPISALAGASFDGIIRIADTGPLGMVTVRGDLASSNLKTAVKSVLNTEVPGASGVTTSGENTVLWMSPDELLVIVPRGDASSVVAAMTAGLKGDHALVIDVSDARAAFTLTGEGPAIRETLAKLTPADMRARSLPTGHVRRTRLAQVPAAFWFSSDTEAQLIAFRSVATYVFGILSHAATPGSEVGHFG